MPKSFRRGYRDTNPTLALRFMQTSTVTITAAQALDARRLLRNAGSTNGLVSVKLHSIRDELDSKCSASAKAYVEVVERHAIKENDAPKAIPGQLYLRTLTQAYELDPAKKDDQENELATILENTLTLTVPLLSETNAGLVSAPDDIGAALIHFLEQ
jgi:hypothetical protein